MQKAGTVTRVIADFHYPEYLCQKQFCVAVDNSCIPSYIMTCL